MQAVQGLLNFAPNGENDGGLVLMKGSAKLFNEFFETDHEQDDHEDKPPPEIKYMDLFLFNKKDVKWFEERGCELEKINMEPGDFVLWDSRTMHYAKFPEGDQIRHAMYICEFPWPRPIWKGLQIELTSITSRHDSKEVRYRGSARGKEDMFRELLRHHALASLVRYACFYFFTGSRMLTGFSNVRPSAEKPMRNGK